MSSTVNGQLKGLSTSLILTTSLLARIAFLLFGLFQDRHMEVPYTDIDYYVFTDAARFVSIGDSPYERATYRYTPLLSWLLVPTTFEPQQFWFEYGKVLFVVCDLVTGYLILKLLDLTKKNRLWSLLWFWNPMVITISTRGSSESLMTAVVMAGVYEAVRHNYAPAGLWIGLATHLKIYPLLYVGPLLLFIDPAQPLSQPFTAARIQFVLFTFFSFATLTGFMYLIYDQQYIDEAFLYHMVRLDHRHNFSVYNLALYFESYTSGSTIHLEKLAFIPQLLIAFLAIPLRLCYKNRDAGVLISALFVQTFAFIAFNKVITSQYFVWFLCFLPIYISRSTLSKTAGTVLTAGWALTQGLWLYNGYLLEFQGQGGIFKTGIWTSSIAFFLWNCIMTKQFVDDVIEESLALEKAKTK